MNMFKFKMQTLTYTHDTDGEESNEDKTFKHARIPAHTQIHILQFCLYVTDKSNIF